MSEGTPSGSDTTRPPPLRVPGPALPGSGGGAGTACAGDASGQCPPTGRDPTLARGGDARSRPPRRPPRIPPAPPGPPATGSRAPPPAPRRPGRPKRAARGTAHPRRISPPAWWAPSASWCRPRPGAQAAAAAPPGNSAPRPPFSIPFEPRQDGVEKVCGGGGVMWDGAGGASRAGWERPGAPAGGGRRDAAGAGPPPALPRRPDRRVPAAPRAPDPSLAPELLLHDPPTAPKERPRRGAVSSLSSEFLGVREPSPGWIANPERGAPRAEGAGGSLATWEAWGLHSPGVRLALERSRPRLRFRLGEEA